MSGSIAISIYKQDGTRQCDPDIKPRPLKVDADLIADLGVRIVGIGKHERLPIYTPAVCHTPTAWANVFSIETTGLTRQQLLQLALHGFRIWEIGAAKSVADNPFPASLLLAARLLSPPSPSGRIAEVIGCIVRIYKTGDMITEDYRSDRVNFEIDPSTSRVNSVWFG